MNLGGGADNDQAIARELFPAMPYEEVKAALHQFLAYFTRHSGPGESFLDFCGRHTVDELRAMCSVRAEVAA